MRVHQSVFGSELAGLGEERLGRGGVAPAGQEPSPCEHDSAAAFATRGKRPERSLGVVPLSLVERALGRREGGPRSGAGRAFSLRNGRRCLAGEDHDEKGGRAHGSRTVRT
jgi:hypothetical protein